ncbi:hypothetical protein [Klebsiella pneumoniae IS22]|nr:hypothetical protein [Klebsiella pneumoniae IS22]
MAAHCPPGGDIINTPPAPARFISAFAPSCVTLHVEQAAVAPVSRKITCLQKIVLLNYSYCF